MLYYADESEVDESPHLTADQKALNKADITRAKITLAQQAKEIRDLARDELEQRLLDLQCWMVSEVGRDTEENELAADYWIKIGEERQNELWESFKR